MGRAAEIIGDAVAETGVRKAGFDPSELRDPHGKWLSRGAGSFRMGERLAHASEKDFTRTYTGKTTPHDGPTYNRKRMHELTHGYSNPGGAIPYVQQEFHVGDATKPKLSADGAAAVIDYYHLQHIREHPHSEAAKRYRRLVASSGP